MAPGLLLLFVTRLLPLGDALATSLQSQEGWGFETYRMVLGSPTFQESLKTTLLFNLVINPLQIFLALVLAVLLAERVPGSTVFRTIALIPIAVPQTVAAVIWGVWLRPDGGLVNGVLTRMGLSAQPFLTASSQALWAIALIASWIGVGYWMSFLVAGIREVPEEVLEAAQVDGASWLRRQVSIVVPLIRRQLAFVLVADTVANFLLFVPVQVLTGGGPARSTNLIMHEVFQEAYVFGDRGFASAEIVVLNVIMLAIVGLQFRLLRGERGASA